MENYLALAAGFQIKDIKIGPRQTVFWIRKPGRHGAVDLRVAVKTAQFWDYVVAIEKDRYTDLTAMRRTGRETVMPIAYGFAREYLV